MATETTFPESLFAMAMAFLAILHLLPTGHSQNPIANLTAYNYLSIQGANSTTGYNTVLCGQPNTTQPNQFGQIYCFDMPLLLEQNLSSLLIGQVQGTFVIISQTGGSVFVTETFSVNNTINQGTFTGVGLEEIGQNSTKPITGGTGDYALAKGIAYTTPLNSGVDSNNNSYFWFMYYFAFST